MRNTLLFVALVLGGASAASGQTLNHCGQIFEGRVRGVRVEKAQYEKVGDEWVEGPRRLSEVSTYREDRLWSEQTIYDDAGNASNIYVRICYENGRYAEIAHYDGVRSLHTRQLFSSDGNVMKFFDAAGNLQGKTVTGRDAAGRLARRTYDGAGRLTREEVHEREGQSFVQKDFNGEGRLLAKAINSSEGANGEGRGRHDLYIYGPDGSVGKARRETVSKAGRRQAEVTTTFATKGWGKRDSTRMEKDERGNIVKMTFYELNEATGEMEPRVARYYEITYF